MNAEMSRDEAVRVLDGYFLHMHASDLNEVTRAWNKVRALTSPPAVPGGMEWQWATVPRDPTPEMLASFVSKWEGTDWGGSCPALTNRQRRRAELGYRAMLAAAPPSEPKCAHDWGDADERQSCAKCGEHIGMDPSEPPSGGELRAWVQRLIDSANADGRRDVALAALVAGLRESDPSPAEQGAREGMDVLEAAKAVGLLDLMEGWTEAGQRVKLGAFLDLATPPVDASEAGRDGVVSAYCMINGCGLACGDAVLPSLAAGRVGVAEVRDAMDTLDYVEKVLRDEYDCKVLADQLHVAALALAGPVVAGEAFGGWHEDSEVFAKAADLSPGVLANPAALGWTLVYADTAKGG